MIQDSGWRGGQSGWHEPLPWTCASGCLRRSRTARRADRSRDVRLSVSCGVKWSQRFQTTVSAAFGRIGGHRRARLAVHRDFLLARIAVDPHITLRRLQAELADRGVDTGSELRPRRAPTTSATPDMLPSQLIVLSQRYRCDGAAARAARALASSDTVKLKNGLRLERLRSRARKSRPSSTAGALIPG